MKQDLENALERLLDNTNPYFERIVSGALRDTIRAHGPITGDNLSSGSKRICGTIRGMLVNGSESHAVDTIVKAQIESLQKELADAYRRINGMNKCRQVMMKKLDEISPGWRDKSGFFDKDYSNDGVVG